MRRKIYLSIFTIALGFHSLTTFAHINHHAHAKKLAKTHSVKTKLTHHKFHAHRHARVINATTIAPPAYLLSSSTHPLVELVNKTVSSLHYSAYKLGGTHIDPARGIYVVDCSSYVDHLIKNTFPEAFQNLSNWSGTVKPTTDDYFHYFNALNNNDKNCWNTLDTPKQLDAGDVIVFRYNTHRGYESGGHVMVVMGKPKKNGDVLEVRVTDSAPSAHSNDTRMRHFSGIGIGTLLLKMNEKTNQAIAYAWKVGAHWKNVSIAMARPNASDNEKS